MVTRRWNIAHTLNRLRTFLRNDQLVLAILAVLVGLAVGGAVIAFREAIILVQQFAHGTPSPYLSAWAVVAPWWRIVLATTLGGLVVGLFIRWVVPGGRPQGVADIIEASALRGSKVPLLSGLGVAAASALSIGVGASVGREGPAVHLGATLGAWVAEKLHLTRRLSRTLLGCGVAAAVAASFNAPIAGALFATEVVIGHYALTAFAPVVIASVAGTIVSRAYFGNFPAFTIGEHAVASVLEFPAFVGLGIVCGLSAIALIRGIGLVQDGFARSPIPGWTRPAVAGLLIGVAAVWLPGILGVGYGVTDVALKISMPLGMLIGLAIGKLVATALCLGAGFGGGIFSPSLVIGAMVGGAYGTLATQVAPALSSGGGAYVLVGMGAMASGTLGAPISTTLIVFEMTGDYALTMAVMIAAVLASVIVRQAHGGSFFRWQLERRGIDLRGGFASALLRAQKVAGVMERRAELVSPEMHLPDLRHALQLSDIGEVFVIGEGGRLLGTVTLADLSEAAFDPTLDDLLNAADVARRRPPVLCPDDDLETALKLMRDSGEQHIAVVQDQGSMTFAGTVHERDVMAAYNRALVEARMEEHD